MSPTTFPVTVHEFLPTPDSKKLTHVYEYGIHDYYQPSPSDSGTQSKSNALLFIGGLGDGPHGVPYIRHIASTLSSASTSAPSSTAAQPTGTQSPNQPWSVFEVRLSSSFSGWGNSSLAQDVDEIAAVVRYLRGELGKQLVALMGHSTGCQDAVAYLRRLDFSANQLPPLDAVILQGPVSDREAIGMTMPAQELAEARSVAEQMISEGRENEYMPREKLPVDMRDTPVTAYRFFSLIGVGGDDDFFSSDFDDTQMAQIWDPLRKPVLIVPSGKDEWVPETVDVKKLMERWRRSCHAGVYSELSGLIPGTNHRVDNAEGREWLADRVSRFLGQVEGGIEIDNVDS